MTFSSRQHHHPADQGNHHHQPSSSSITESAASESLFQWDLDDADSPLDLISPNLPSSLGTFLDELSSGQYQSGDMSPVPLPIPEYSSESGTVNSSSDWRQQQHHHQEVNYEAPVAAPMPPRRAASMPANSSAFFQSMEHKSSDAKKRDTGNRNLGVPSSESGMKKSTEGTQQVRTAKVPRKSPLTASSHHTNAPRVTQNNPPVKSAPNNSNLAILPVSRKKPTQGSSNTGRGLIASSSKKTPSKTGTEAFKGSSLTLIHSNKQQAQKASPSTSSSTPSTSNSAPKNPTTTTTKQTAPSTKPPVTTTTTTTTTTSAVVPPPHQPDTPRNASSSSANTTSTSITGSARPSIIVPPHLRNESTHSPAENSPKTTTTSTKKKRKRESSVSPTQQRKKRKRAATSVTPPTPSSTPTTPQSSSSNKSSLPTYIKTLPKEEREKMGNAKKWVGKTRRLHGYVYGQIGSVFKEYAMRTNLRSAGLHMSSMAGIDGVGHAPARCVVANSGGGYDDDDDSGDILMYTGQGKVASGDQKMTRYNLSLKKNMDEKIPVRVVRGPSLRSAFAPGSGNYRFDGLYWVVSYKQEEQDGRKIFIFKLVRLPGQPSIQELRDTSYVKKRRKPVKKSKKKKRTTTTTTPTPKKRKRRKVRLQEEMEEEEIDFDEEEELEARQERAMETYPENDDGGVDNQQLQQIQSSLWSEIFGEEAPLQLHGVQTNVARKQRRGNASRMRRIREMSSRPHSLWQEEQVPPVPRNNHTVSVRGAAMRSRMSSNASGSSNNSTNNAPNFGQGNATASGQITYTRPVHFEQRARRPGSPERKIEKHHMNARQKMDAANLAKLSMRAKMNQIHRRRALNNLVNRYHKA